MFISSFLFIIKLFLFIEIASSFKAPKHSFSYYFKTPNNVFLTNPKNHTTSYGIYVAGKTITVDIPRSVVDVFDIINWKVINADKDRLMFVYKNKPQILIDQKTIKEMEYPGELSDSIIAFGDNEALHVPTINNSNLTQPDRKWNYIELLHFDAKSEKVSVIRSLPWLKDDDWKYVMEWKMTDYIHFGDKLYLAMKRATWNDVETFFTWEVFIIRMCLDKGTEIISSAIELRLSHDSNNYAYPDSNEALLIFFAKPHATPDEPKTLYLFTTMRIKFEFISERRGVVFRYYYIGHLISYFDHVAKLCASGSKNFTTLRNHLRSEPVNCVATTYETCSTKVNVIPSADIGPALYELTTTWQIDEPILFEKTQYYSVPYPYYYNVIFFHHTPISSTHYKIITSYYNNSLLSFDFKNYTYNNEYVDANVQTESFINKHPLGGYYVTKGTNKILELWNPNLCEELATCIHCLMYGQSINCVWSNSKCIYQPKSKPGSAVNYCFKIIKISPAMVNSSKSNDLTIELDKPLNLTESEETLVVKAGPNNYCINITISGKIIKCILQSNRSGEFNITVNMFNKVYSDVSSVGAESTDKVKIPSDKDETGYASNAQDNSWKIFIILFLALILSSFLFLAYTKCDRQQLRRFPEPKKAPVSVSSQGYITPAVAQTASPSMHTRIHPTTSNKPSSKEINSIPADKLGKPGKSLPMDKLNKSRKSKPKEKRDKSVKSMPSDSSQSNSSKQFPTLKSKSMVNRYMKY